MTDMIKLLNRHGDKTAVAERTWRLHILKLGINRIDGVTETCNLPSGNQQENPNQFLVRGYRERKTPQMVEQETHIRRGKMPHAIL